jgi:hypothetical protein
MATVSHRPTAGKATPNGKPHKVARRSRVRISPEARVKVAALKAEVAYLQREPRDEIDRERDRERRELVYLTGLLAHPNAEDMMADVYNLLEQTLGTDDHADSQALVATLVLVEALKALREKVERGRAVAELEAGKGGAA